MISPLRGFSGDFLSFADPYVEGPVPQTQSLEEFVRIRADYLGQGDREAFEEFFSSYLDLERAREYSEVHIWMEHDSYDQLILARLLYFFSDASARPKQLRMINVTHFPGFERFVGLGQLPPQALRLLWEDFEDVTEAQLILGKQVWNRAKSSFCRSPVATSNKTMIRSRGSSAASNCRTSSLVSTSGALRRLALCRTH